MFFLNKNNFLTIVVAGLFFSYAVDAVTKLKIVNKTNKDISVEIFKVIKTGKDAKLERIQKSLCANGEKFIQSKLNSDTTYMIKIVSDWQLLVDQAAAAKKKYKPGESGEEFLLGLDASIMAEEHYFIISPLTKKQVVHINFEFDPDSENPAFSMRETKSNIAAGIIQYGTSFDNRHIDHKFDKSLLDTKICFIYDENLKEVLILTNQLMSEFKKQIRSAKLEMDDIKGKFPEATRDKIEIKQTAVKGEKEREEDNDDDSSEEISLDKEAIKIVKKASMRLLLQDNFNAKNAGTTYNAVLMELKQINAHKKEKED